MKFTSTNGALGTARTGRRPSGILPQAPRVLRSVRAVAVLGLVATGAGCADESTATKAGESDTVSLITYDAYVLPEAGKQVGSGGQYKVVALPSGDAGEMLSKAMLQGKALRGDVMFGVDTSLLSRAQKSGLFATLPSDLSEAVPTAYRDTSDDHLVPIDVGQVCINADSKWFAERNLEIPTNFEQLVQPAYKNLLVTENPAVSSPGLMFLAATVETLGDGWEKWWAQLRSNGVKIAADWSAAYESDYSVSGGKYPLMVSYGTSPVAEVDPADPSSTPRSVIVESTCVEQVEYAGILKSSANPAGAEALLRTMLTPEFQAQVPDANYVFPIDSSVSMSPAFEKYAVRVSEPIRLNAEIVSSDRDSWLQSWQEIFA